MFTYHFVAFDFEIEYAYRPNDDIYQEILPKELKLSVSVPANFKELLFDEQKALLKDAVKEELTQIVLFDTPDEPDFAIDDVDFCFEDAEIEAIGSDSKGEFIFYSITEKIETILNQHNCEESTIEPYTKADISTWEIYYNPDDEEWHFLDELQYDDTLSLDIVIESIIKVYALKL